MLGFWRRANSRGAARYDTGVADRRSDDCRVSRAPIRCDTLCCRWQVVTRSLRPFRLWRLILRHGAGALPSGGDTHHVDSSSSGREWLTRLAACESKFFLELTIGASWRQLGPPRPNLTDSGRIKGAEPVSKRTGVATRADSRRQRAAGSPRAARCVRTPAPSPRTRGEPARLERIERGDVLAGVFREKAHRLHHHAVLGRSGAVAEEQHSARQVPRPTPACDRGPTNTFHAQIANVATSPSFRDE